MSERVEGPITDASPVIGLVQPFDSALDHEYWRFLPRDISLLIARTPLVTGPLSADLMLRTSDDELVLPVVEDMATGIDPDVIAYSCTSGSFLRGLEGEVALRERMEARGARRAVTTSGALLLAVQYLSVSRLAVATPYDDVMTASLLAFLEEGGIEPVSCNHLGLRTDPARVPPADVVSLAARTDDPRAEAVFISCTNLRTVDLIPTIEQRLDKPVLTANQVVMWAALRAIGRTDSVTGHRLFEVHAA